MLSRRQLRAALSRQSDLLVAGLFALIAQSEVWLGWSDGGIGEPLRGAPWAEAVLLGAVALSLAWRRSAPFAALVATGASLCLLAFAVTPTAPFLAGLLPLLILTFSTAVHDQMPRDLVGLAVSIATVAALTSRIPALRSGGEIAFGSVAIVGTWTAGLLVARRQRMAEGAAARAAELELDRERARSALVDERSRIARELHDVIAHSVSLMGVQAGAARIMLDSNPRAARDSLLSIEATARQAVDELRRLLGILRASEPEAARSPQPGLAELPELAEQIRRAGLAVELALEGHEAPLARGVDLAAYRIRAGGADQRAQALITATGARQHPACPRPHRARRRR
jgi:signal transduction histidine kinase